MSLSKEITLTIKDYSVTLSSPLKFYVNDCLDLIFTINKWGINNANNNSILTINVFPLDGLTAQLLIENSEGTDTIEATTVFKNSITFKLTNKYTRAPGGKGKMQIRLTDDDGCELKLPHFEYEVQASINEELDSTIPSQVMRAYATEDNKLLLTEDGKLLLY